MRIPLCRLVEPEQRADEAWTIGACARRVVDHFDPIGFENRHVDVLAAGAAVVFDDQQSWRRHFEHQTRRGHDTRGAPHAQRAVHVPHAKMNAGSLYGRRDAHQTDRSEGQRRGKEQWLAGRQRRHEHE